MIVCKWGNSSILSSMEKKDTLTRLVVGTVVGCPEDLKDIAQQQKRLYLGLRYPQSHYYSRNEVLTLLVPKPMHLPCDSSGEPP